MMLSLLQTPAFETANVRGRHPRMARLAVALMKRGARLAFVTLMLLLWITQSAAAQCFPPNGNDTQPDTAEIQCLLDQGGTIVLDADVSQGYFIAAPGLVLWQSGTTLTASTAFGNRALLRATADLNVPMLQVADSTVSNYTISSIFFYGDRFSRTNPNCVEGDQSVNLWLKGSGWLVDNIESDTVPCHTSTVVEGSSSFFEIRNSVFANNGWSEPELGGACSGTRCWADGLTVHACVNGWIHNNQFFDNTDVDLVVGGGSSCTIEFNTVQHTLSYGFAGFHVGWFPGGDGNHSGSTYANNTVSSGLDKLAFGVGVGFHPWDATVNLADAGSVLNNSASGAVINLAVEGIAPAGAGLVSGNSVSGAQGTNGFGSCTTASNFTAYQPHAGNATLQPGWFELQFDNGQCIPR